MSAAPTPDTSPGDEINQILTGYAKYVKNAQGLYSYATEKKLSKKQAKDRLNRLMLTRAKTELWKLADASVDAEYTDEGKKWTGLATPRFRIKRAIAAIDAQLEGSDGK